METKRELTKQEVYALATAGNPIINDGGNKIEFAKGEVYAKDFRSGQYRKVKVFTL